MFLLLFASSIGILWCSVQCVCSKTFFPIRITMGFLVLSLSTSWVYVWRILRVPVVFAFSTGCGCRGHFYCHVFFALNAYSRFFPHVDLLPTMEHHTRLLFPRHHTHLAHGMHYRWVPCLCVKLPACAAHADSMVHGYDACIMFYSNTLGCSSSFLANHAENNQSRVWAHTNVPQEKARNTATPFVQPTAERWTVPWRARRIHSHGVCRSTSNVFYPNNTRGSHASDPPELAIR